MFIRCSVCRSVNPSAKLAQIKYKFNKKTGTHDLTLDNLIYHSNHLSNTPHDSLFNADENASRTITLHIEELDRPFTVINMQKTISKLKRHKSADLSKNVADFLFDCN